MLEHFHAGMSMLREHLPVLSVVDNTGIIVGAYLGLAIVLYLSSWMFNDRKQPDAVDRRALFDSQTRIRELSVEIQQLRSEQPTAEQQDELDELRRRVDEQNETLSALRAAAVDPEVLAAKEAEIDRLGREHAARLTAIGHDRKSEAQKHANEVARLKKEICEKEEMIATLRAERDELRQKLGERGGGRSDLDAKYAELTSKHDRLVQVLADQRSQMAAAVNRDENAQTAALLQRHQQRESSGDREDPNSTLTDRKSLSSIGSRESKLPLPKPQTKWTAAELEDLAAARAEVRRVESERDQLKRQLQAAKAEIESLRSKLEEANAIKAKLEQKEQQMAEMLQMIKDKDQRLAKVADMQEDMFETDAKRVRAENTARDLQERLRRAEFEEQKLRNQWYHDERKLNAKIRTLEKTIDQFRTATQPFGKPIGASSPTFGARDYSDAAGGQDVPDLWSPFNNKK